MKDSALGVHCPVKTGDILYEKVEKRGGYLGISPSYKEIALVHRGRRNPSRESTHRALRA